MSGKKSDGVIVSYLLYFKFMSFQFSCKVAVNNEFVLIQYIYSVFYLQNF